MSRTLVHRPPRTWFDLPSCCVPEHDHSEGPCDLPTLSEWRSWAGHGEGDPPWRCGWELLRERLPRLCGCGMCTGSHWHREDRRRDRHRSKVWLATGAWAADWEERSAHR